MAHALGRGWAAAGHDVMIGARAESKAARAAGTIGHGARSGDLRTAAADGDVTVLAVPPSAADEVIRGVGAEVFAGRTVIDCMNALVPAELTNTGPRGFVLVEPAVAEQVAATLPQALLVKAFNLCAAEVWESDRRTFDGRRLIVPLCGNDSASLDRVAGLARDLSLEPVVAGDLRQARHLEAAAALVIGLWSAGHDARAMLPPLEVAR
jgi:8-hydroxy-5-deazaflavin:NADPH oxidoreductase